MTIPHGGGYPVDPIDSVAIDGNTIVDRARLVSISEGDREFELELLEAYIDDSRDCIAAMEAAMSVSDWDKLGVIAHQLKGASGNVGAIQMQRFCAQLEQDARAKCPTNAIQSLIQGLESVQLRVNQW